MSQNPAKAVIEYDKNYGFPTMASFDMDVMIADEEIVVTFLILSLNKAFSSLLSNVITY